jgi:hypothetical protein
MRAITVYAPAPVLYMKRSPSGAMASALTPTTSYSRRRCRRHAAHERLPAAAGRRLQRAVAARRERDDRFIAVVRR